MNGENTNEIEGDDFDIDSQFLESNGFNNAA